MYNVYIHRACLKVLKTSFTLTHICYMIFQTFSRKLIKLIIFEFLIFIRLLWVLHVTTTHQFKFNSNCEKYHGCPTILNTFKYFINYNELYV